MASSCVWLLLGFCASSVHGHLESEAVFPSSFHGFCKVKRDGLYEVAPHSRKFIVCVNGVLTLRLCPLQEMFDAISGHCIPKALGPAVDLALKCRHLRDGFYSAKEQCRPYYIVCFNNEGKVKRCERGEVFDSVSGFCKEPKFVAECNQGKEEVCAPLTSRHGDRFPDPNNCHGFIECERGKNVYKNCPRWQGWHRHHNQCVPLRMLHVWCN